MRYLGSPDAGMPCARQVRGGHFSANAALRREAGGRTTMRRASAVRSSAWRTRCASACSAARMSATLSDADCERVTLEASPASSTLSDSEWVREVEEARLSCALEEARPAAERLRSTAIGREAGASGGAANGSDTPASRANKGTGEVRSAFVYVPLVREAEAEAECFIAAGGE